MKRAVDGELLVRSPSLFQGYDGSDPSACSVDAEGWLHTGDLATIDSDGFVFVQGRKKHVAITAHGRNVFVEAVEARYKTVPGLRSAVVFADGLDGPVGVFVLEETADRNQVEKAVAVLSANELPVTDRVEHALFVSANEAARLGWFTITERPLRQLIWSQIQREFVASEPPRA